MKILIIGGTPASGKTTLVREFMAQWPSSCWSTFKKDTVCGHLNRDARICVFGTYNGHTFDGTDRLSMAVQPRMQLFMRAAAKEPSLKSYFYVLEGDRLFNKSFIQFAKELAGDVHLLGLRATGVELDRRHVERRDNQPEAFLKANRTKIENIKAVYPNMIWWNHENHDDTALLVKWIKGLWKA